MYWAENHAFPPADPERVLNPHGRQMKRTTNSGYFQNLGASSEIALSEMHFSQIPKLDTSPATSS